MGVGDVSVLTVHAVVEAGAALYCLLGGRTGRYTGDLRTHPIELWWAVAVLGIGLASFLARGISDADPGKQVLLLLFLVYHLAMVFFNFPYRALGARPPTQQLLPVPNLVVGTAVHSWLAYSFYSILSGYSFFTTTFWRLLFNY